MTNMMEAAQKQLREMLMQAMGQLVTEGKIPAEALPAFRLSGLKSRQISRTAIFLLILRWLRQRLCTCRPGKLQNY